MSKHQRFLRAVFASRDELTGALAKWLVIQSPYVVPDKLAVCLAKFHHSLLELPEFAESDLPFAVLDLRDLAERLDPLLCGIEEIKELSRRKNGRTGPAFTFSDTVTGRTEPDDDFIDICAVAQNIACEFAMREDAEAWLNHNHDLVSDRDDAERRQWLCSGYGVFPDGTECPGCKDCEGDGLEDGESEYAR